MVHRVVHRALVGSIKCHLQQSENSGIPWGMALSGKLVWDSVTRCIYHQAKMLLGTASLRYSEQAKSY